MYLVTETCFPQLYRFYLMNSVSLRMHFESIIHENSLLLYYIKYTEGSRFKYSIVFKLRGSVVSKSQNYP